MYNLVGGVRVWGGRQSPDWNGPESETRCGPKNMIYLKKRVFFTYFLWIPKGVSINVNHILAIVVEPDSIAEDDQKSEKHTFCSPKSSEKIASSSWNVFEKYGILSMEILLNFEEFSSGTFAELKITFLLFKQINEFLAPNEYVRLPSQMSPKHVLFSRKKNVVF